MLEKIISSFKDLFASAKNLIAAKNKEETEDALIVQFLETFKGTLEKEYNFNTSQWKIVPKGNMLGNYVMMVNFSEGNYGRGLEISTYGIEIGCDIIFYVGPPAHNKFYAAMCSALIKHNGALKESSRVEENQTYKILFPKGKRLSKESDKQFIASNNDDSQQDGNSKKEKKK